MSLKATLTGSQIKHLKIALQCLGRIGSDLLLEGFPEKVVLRSINSSKSAYFSVSFQNTFFDEYNVFQRNIVQAGVLMKHVLTAFRTQKISRLTLHLDTDANTLLLVVHADNGLEKRYTVPCLEAEILQATVDKDMFPTYLLAEAAELNRLLSSFHTTVAEITIIATPDSEAGPHQASKTVQMRSFNDPAKAHADKALFTQLLVDTREVFLHYQHNSEAVSDVTFNVKDFRHMLSMCESLGASVAIRFDQPGAPLLVEPQFRGTYDIGCEAELILATLMESQQTEPLSQQPQPPAEGHLGPAPGSVVPGDTPWNARGGRTPGTALRGNLRTPVSGGRSSSSGGASGRAAHNPLSTVAAATTRPSRFMQGAARGGHAPGHQAPPEDTPAATGPNPPNSYLATPRSGGRLTGQLRPEGQAASIAQPAGRHQWQDSGDVSISGSGAGPAGGALPHDDPSIHTHRSARSHEAPSVGQSRGSGLYSDVTLRHPSPDPADQMLEDSEEQPMQDDLGFCNRWARLVQATFESASISSSQTGCTFTMTGKAAKKLRQPQAVQGDRKATSRKSAAATAETLETWKSVACMLAVLLLLCVTVLQDSELRLMTIAQLINGTRESALLRVARFAKQFAKLLHAVKSEARKAEQETYSLISEDRLLHEQVELEDSGIKSAPTPKEVSERAARVGEIQKQLQQARENQQSLLQHALIRDEQISKLERASEAIR